MTFQMEFGLLLIALALFWAGLLLWTRPRSIPPRRARPASPPDRRIPVRPIPVSGEEQLWREKLLTITRGNVGAIERGVAAKQRRFPDMSEGELLKLLYEEYLRDGR